jgi:hypothetical protein
MGPKGTKKLLDYDFRVLQAISALKNKEFDSLIKAAKAF